MNESETRILDILDGRTLIIGREGHVYIGDPSVSKQHAEISISGGKIRLRDLKSTNGTFVVRQNEPIPIKDGYVHLHQTIMIGGHRQQVRSLLETIGAISGAGD